MSLKVYDNQYKKFSILISSIRLYMILTLILLLFSLIIFLILTFYSVASVIQGKESSSCKIINNNHNILVSDPHIHYKIWGLDERNLNLVIDNKRFFDWPLVLSSISFS